MILFPTAALRSTWIHVKFHVELSRFKFRKRNNFLARAPLFLCVFRKPLKENADYKTLGSVKKNWKCFSAKI